LRVEVLILLALVALLSACKSEAVPEPKLAVEDLQNPETCRGCHPTHYREWKASMHAYATDDPVFAAMNAFGQQETNGELGTFCVNCHAPMAVKAGITDGSAESVAAIPDHMKGVTCYFCHNAVEVDGENNAVITLANDDIMRAALSNPIEPSAHRVEGSPLLDSRNPESTRLCGGCHDIVNDAGVHLERTFAEYKESIFAQDGTTCSSCHMPARPGFAAEDPTGARVAGRPAIHSHLWPGVDVAMTPWPDREAYEAAVVCALDQSISFKRGDTIHSLQRGLVYYFETIAGHKMPSGASQDRRLWVEIIAFDEEDEIVCSLGNVPDDHAVATFQDPILCAVKPEVANDTVSFPLYRDRMFDADGEETHMFWRAAPSADSVTGVVSKALPTATGFMADGITPASHGEELVFPSDSLFDGRITRVTVRLKMRAMDFDVLEELVDAQVLDEAVLDEVRTFTLANASVDFVLDPASGVFEVVPVPERTTDCGKVFRCAVEPEAADCED
jgi:nitrate/TMAO reductase-like tetraheme cytochrome c subunit